MKKKDWDCAKDGHIPGSATQKNTGLSKGATTVTWCMICRKRLSK